VERQQHFLDALCTAIAEGWSSLFALILSEGDVKGQVVEWEAPERKVLDHRIVGYSGGATITAVLDGPGLGFEEAATSLATLGRHLTTWSPKLLKYRLQRIEISLLEQPGTTTTGCLRSTIPRTANSDAANTRHGSPTRSSRIR